MMQSNRFVLAVLIIAAGFALATAVHADDTEVFVTQAGDIPDAGRSNILFIIDNSASMDSNVQTQVAWNPSTRFDGCYDSDAVYFGNTTTPPPCQSPDFFAKASNRCEDSRSALASLGQYSGLVLNWVAVRERWEPLAANDESRPVECEADRGIDGDGSSGERYAANGPEGPWAADAGQEPAWNTPYTLFDGNWLNWHANPPTVTETRLQIVQHVVNEILDNLEGVNVGLMQFNFDEGGAVTQAVENVATSRAAMQAAVNRLTPFARTPLSETMYEAVRYFRGGGVDYGNTGPVRSVAESRANADPNGANYQSPITAACQKNFIVLLTDGEPLSDNNAILKIQDLPDFHTLVGAQCDGSGDGLCLDDVAQYLYLNDFDPSLDGLQNVTTYTVGFDVDVPLLASTASRGGGQYFLADDTGSLAAALTEVVAGIVERSSTFTAPAAPVSAFNRAAAARDVFVSMFQPAATTHWPGNLKKYRFVDNQLVDQDGRNAVDPVTGFFDSNAFSFWSATRDGDRVREGGAASQLPAPTPRNLYTDIAGPDLASDANQVAVSNIAITPARLGVAPQDRNTLIQWIRGADIRDLDRDGDTAEARHEMGDPLHVRPVTVNYGTTADAPDTVVFIATNDGFLHAVNAVSGQEIWSYIPQRLLMRQNELFLNQQAPVRRYGLDGEIRLFTGPLTPGATDSRMLIFGMGRGGDAVFAVNVTNRNSPRLQWVIDSSTPEFSSLGQTWAAPEVARVNVGGTEHTVVLLSGGYDDGQDNRGSRTDNVGNAIFMVDLASGTRLWSAGVRGAGHTLDVPAMQYSFPAAPRVLDITGDGLADRLYIGDMGGQLWRLDISNGNSAAELGAAGVLASLGAAGVTNPPASEVRRFYNTPDVVFVNCIRGNFLAINIGSGYRGHPLDTDVADAFFSVRDRSVFVPMAVDAPAITVDDLLDITTDPSATVPPENAGWQLRMVEDSGEKILSEAITLNNTVSFTSFSPAGRVSACAGGLGVNRDYEVDACNGRPVNNLDGSIEPGPLSVDDRLRVLNQAGIAPGTLFLVGPPNQPITRCIGLECFTLTGANMRRTFWMQEPSR